MTAAVENAARLGIDSRAAGRLWEEARCPQQASTVRHDMRKDAVFPDIHTLYDYYERFSLNGIHRYRCRHDHARGCGKDELAEKSRSSAGSLDEDDRRSWPASCLAWGACTSATDMEIPSATRSRRRSKRKAPSSCPVAARGHRAPLAGEVTLEHRADEGVARLTCGSAAYSLNTYGPEDFPACRRSSRTAPSRSSARPSRHDRTRGPLRVPGRVASGLRRHPRALRGREASWPRPTRTDSASRRPRFRAGRADEAIVPPGAPGAGASGQSAESDTIEVGVQENQVVFGVDGVWLTACRIDGQFPNYKQLLRAVRGGGPPSARGAARRRPPNGCSRSVAASAALRRG